MEKFTGRKWEVSEAEKGLHTIWAEESLTMVARTCFAPASEANARLIAAAPEMYGLLKDILNQGYSATTKPIQDLIQSLLNSIDNG